MGIKIFYIISIIYAVISSTGILRKQLPQHFIYIFLGIIIIYYLYYVYRRKPEFFNTVLGGIIVNASVQLTGGITSPLFLVYLLILPIIGYKEIFTNYWIIAFCLLGVETLSSLFSHNILLLPLVIFAGAIMIFGAIINKQKEKETLLKRALTKFESREDFFAPADFEHDKIKTSIRDIDRYKGIERPLLYFVKFIHNIFNAHTTVIFSYYNNELALIKGFSRSELFRPNTVIDVKSSIYQQAISERKSVFIKEFSLDTEKLGYYKGDVKITSVLIAPIIVFDEVEGIFVIDSGKRQLGDEDKEVFGDASKAAGYLLSMIRVYEKERHERKYRNAISEVAKKMQKELDLKLILANAIQSFKNFMDFDDISIAKIDEENNYGVVIQSTYIKEDTKFSLDDGLVGFVARHKNTIIKDDLREGNLIVLKKGVKTPNASFVGVPIKQDDDLFGVIWLEDHRKKKFNSDDVESINILASQLSLAWQRAQLYYKLKDLAILDGLTGLYNHRHFQEILEDEIGKSKDLVLIMLDIDHFKQINDTYGHLAGDEVLKFLSKLIKNTGIAARYGGEEFAIILPNYSIKKGVEIAVHLKDRLKKSEIKIDKAKIEITISAGIAHYPNDAETRIELIEKADKALYNAKRTGRDKIVVAQAIEPEVKQDSKTP